MSLTDFYFGAIFLYLIFFIWCYILFPAYLISCPPSHPCVCPAAAKQQGQDRNGLLYTCWRCLVIIYVESDMGKWRFLFLFLFFKNQNDTHGIHVRL